MFHGHLNYFQKSPLGGGPNAKPGDHGTPNAHNRWFILLYHMWGPTWIKIHWNSIWLKAMSHMTSHYSWGSVIAIHDFGGVLGQPLDTFFWALTIPWSGLLGHVWSGPKYRKWCSLLEASVDPGFETPSSLSTPEASTFPSSTHLSTCPRFAQNKANPKLNSLCPLCCPLFPMYTSIFFSFFGVTSVCFFKALRQNHVHMIVLGLHHAFVFCGHFCRKEYMCKPPMSLVRSNILVEWMGMQMKSIFPKLVCGNTWHMKLLEWTYWIQNLIRSYYFNLFEDHKYAQNPCAMAHAKETQILSEQTWNMRMRLPTIEKDCFYSTPLKLNWMQVLHQTLYLVT